MGDLFITLDSESLALARGWADAIEANLKPTPNYTGLSVPGRFYVGYLGELAVADWLTRGGLDVTHRVVTNGESQRSEISVRLQKRSVDVEVKTAGQPTITELMMPAAQKRDFDVLVGAQRMAKAVVAIRGWIGRREFDSAMTERQYRIPTMACAYADLRAPDTLLEMLRGMSEPPAPEEPTPERKAPQDQTNAEWLAEYDRRDRELMGNANG